MLKLGVLRATPVMAGVSVLGRSPRRRIPNAEAWSRVVFRPREHRWSRFQSFFGAGFPPGHGCEVPLYFHQHSIGTFSLIEQLGDEPTGLAPARKTFGTARHMTLLTAQLPLCPPIITWVVS